MSQADHKHEIHHSVVRKSQFEEVFEAMPIPDLQDIDVLVEKCIEKHFSSLDNKSTYNFIHSCIDLTALNATDTEDSIYRMIQKVNELDDLEPSIRPVASICVYPNFMKILKEHLAVEGVNICSVAGGFPSAQTFMEVKVAEIALAIQDGANEIDIVLPIGEFLSGNYQEVADQIHEQRATAKNAILKVILETGALKTPENIYRASVLSLFSDADFIKTSTGKGYDGATSAAAYVMAVALKNYYEKYGKLRGLKISGGVRTVKDALVYLCIVKEILGDKWMTPELFRLGASSLESDVLSHLK